MFSLIEKLHDKYSFRLSMKTGRMLEKWKKNPVLCELAFWFYSRPDTAWLIHMLLTIGAMLLAWKGILGASAVLTVLTLLYYWRTRDSYMDIDSMIVEALWFLEPRFLRKAVVLDIAAVAGIGLLHYLAGIGWITAVLLSVNGAILLPRVVSMVKTIVMAVFGFPVVLYKTIRDRNRNPLLEKAYGISEIDVKFSASKEVYPWDAELPVNDAEEITLHKRVREAVLKATKGKTIQKNRVLLAYEANKQNTEKLLHEVFLQTETAALECAVKNKLVVAPDPHLLTVQYCRRNPRTGKDEKVKGRGATAELHYFSAWEASLGFLKAPGEVGAIFAQAQELLKKIKKRDPLISWVTLMFLFVGVLCCLVDAPLLPFLPDLVAVWMEKYLLARIVILIPIVLAGVFLMMMGAALGEGTRDLPVKIVANGIFRLIIGIGTILVAVNTLMMGSPESLAFLVLGAYYVLLAFACWINDILEIFRGRKEKRAVKAEFVDLLENYMRSVRLYMNFHRDWAERCMDPVSYKAAYKGLKKMKKSCDYLAKHYRKYKKR